MKAAICHPVMIARIAINPIVRLWNRSLMFRVLTLPVVILVALPLSYAMKQNNPTKKLS